MSEYGWQAPPGLELDEMIVVGSGIDNDRPPAASELVAAVKSEHFYKPAHQMIWAAVERLVAGAKPVDPASVMEELRRTGQLTKMGAGPYLHTCLTHTNMASAAYHAEKVVADWRRRQVWQAASRIMQAAGDLGFDYDTGFAWARDQMDAALSSLGDTAVTDLESLTWDVLADLETGAEPEGLTTGLRDLDAILTRLRPGQLVVVAGRPAAGKSVVGLNLAAHAALTLRKPVHFHSLEMSSHEVTLRLLAAEGPVNLSSLLTRKLHDLDWRRLGNARERIAGAPLKIFDKPNTGLADIRGELSVAKQRSPAGLVVVDYMQLMASPRRVENRQQEVAAMARGLKLLAAEYNVPVVALAQLNRGPEHRSTGRPVLSDLRESGEIEQSADVVILLHREDMYDDKSDRPGEMDMIIAKHRNGRTDTVAVCFQGYHARCMDLARNYPVAPELGHTA